MLSYRAASVGGRADQPTSRVLIYGTRTASTDQHHIPSKTPSNPSSAHTPNLAPSSTLAWAHFTTVLNHASQRVYTCDPLVHGSGDAHTVVRLQASIAGRGELVTHESGPESLPRPALTRSQVVRRVERGMRARAPVPSTAGGAPDPITVTGTTYQYGRFYTGSGMILRSNPSGK